MAGKHQREAGAPLPMGSEDHRTDSSVLPPAQGSAGREHFCSLCCPPEVFAGNTGSPHPAFPGLRARSPPPALSWPRPSPAPPPGFTPGLWAHPRAQGCWVMSVPPSLCSFLVMRTNTLAMKMQVSTCACGHQESWQVCTRCHPRTSSVTVSQPAFPTRPQTLCTQGRPTTASLAAAFLGSLPPPISPVPQRR